MPRAGFARTCRPRPESLSRLHLGCDRSGTLEYVASGAHVYAFGPEAGAPRRVGPLRSPNRAAVERLRG